MKSTVLYLALFVSMIGCTTRIPLSPNYFSSPSRTGFILRCTMESTGSSSGAGMGLAGWAISSALQPKSKYDEALHILQPVLAPDRKVKELYIDAFYNKGKKIIFLEDSLKGLSEFGGGLDTTKKYFKQDLRFLKEKYQIDELLLVTVQYGVYAKYSYGIETSRYGKMYIKPTIINLKDNSLLYKENTSIVVPVKGEWNTPPQYEKLRNGIEKAIEEAIAKEKLKYQ